MSMLLNDDTFNATHHVNCVDKIDLKAWCEKLYKNCKSESDSGSYWDGKADAFAEVLNYLAGH